MDVLKAIEKRRSIRKFKSEPIDNGDLKKILEAGRLAPSGGNRQPWYFIVVRDSKTKKTLAYAANNQKFVADAGVVIVALGASGTEQHPLSPIRISYIQDPMIAVEHFILTATALGYGTCWIGAFNEEEVKRILKIPRNAVVIALVPVGVPDESPPPRSRKEFSEVFFKEAFGIPLKL